MSELHKRKKRSSPSEETKIKLSIANKGKKKPEGFSEICRDRMLGHKHTEEAKIKIGLATLGRKVSEETKLKMSLKSKGRKKPEGFGEKVTERLLGSKLSPERIEKQRQTLISKYALGEIISPMKGKVHTEEAKQKNREATIKRILEGKYPKTHTKIEILMSAELTKLNIPFIHQYNFNNKFVCDFAIPDYKIIIECDGDYWHRREDAKKRDAPKNAYIPKCGWELLRFWEFDINNNINICMDKIKETINYKKA